MCIFYRTLADVNPCVCYEIAKLLLKHRIFYSFKINNVTFYYFFCELDYFYLQNRK